jgi:hypothetical protein
MENLNLIPAKNQLTLYNNTKYNSTFYNKKQTAPWD